MTAPPASLNPASPSAANDGRAGGGIDDPFAGPPQRKAAAPARAGVLGALLWLAGLAALAAALMQLPEGWRPGSPALASAAALALTLPVAAAVIWSSLAGRIAELDRRIDASAHAAAKGAQAGAARPQAAVSEGLTREELTRALSAAARDALDAERGAIARRMAELSDTQRRLDAAVSALGAGQAVAVTPPDPAPVAVPVSAPEPAPRRSEASLPDPQAVSSPEPRPEAPSAAARRAPGAIPPSPPPPPETDADQGSLPLAAQPATPPQDWSRIAVALDFPKDARDEDGFAALAEATRDRGVAELLQAAEDTLTIFAQHGLYMEDLPVRHAPAALWSRFASGERGPALHDVGGVDKVEAVETVRALLKKDPVFRDTGMHLMRRFDAVLRRAAAEPRGDGRLLDLADSRTGRAFMLTAQAVGAFD